jgi:hypothetical protein
MKDRDPGNKKPKDDKEGERNRKSWRSALAASQFAYTLVIATLLMGWIGHWLGSLLGGGLWSTILMFVLGAAGFVGEMWRMYKFFGPKDGDDDDGPGGRPGDTPPGTRFGVKRNDRLPDGPEGDIERPGDDNDRRDNDDVERGGGDPDRRGGGDPDRRGGDDIERPGEADDRPFTGTPFGGLPGDGLSREELDEFLREIEGLTKVEREEIDRELGNQPDDASGDDTAGRQDSQPKPVDGGKDKNNKGSNE